MAAAVRGLLRFHATLSGHRLVALVPDATPFVSIYAGPRLCGCFGESDGSPGERLARAFLRAAHDGRFAPITERERPVLAVHVAYPRAPRLIDPETAAATLEPGTHGVALVRDRGPSAVLLPHVARDERLDARALLAALLRKAGCDADVLRSGGLYAFEAEDVVVWSQPPRRRRSDVPIEAAADWLASLVDDRGAVTFAVDPRGRKREVIGVMHHGRAAVVVRALVASGRHRRTASRARAWLEGEVRGALDGHAGAGWPEDPDLVAGTLALAILAGIDLCDLLVDFVAAKGAPRSPWHAAQVVAALGGRAPEALWTLCVEDLVRHPVAPWTVAAADARSERAVADRAARAVASSLRRDLPFAGGSTMTPVPETALTAMAVEVLAPRRAPWAQAAARRGRAFLERMQLLERRITGAVDPDLAYGAFSASPVVDGLRGDVTGHALLALSRSP